MSPRRTRRLGRYHLIERIGAGGMARLYRGFTYDEDGFRRDVAVKLLLPVADGEKRQRYVKMLADEYRLISRLRHPNIVEVYELGEADDELYIAMEYVDGRDLRSTLHRARRTDRPIAVEDAAWLLAEALDGLEHAHRAADEQGRPLGIVHRDFSPANVLVGFDGRVRICDFGIAKARDNQVRTRAGIIKGKVRYMSPEQARGKPLDGRSDVFAAGSVLYEMLAGRPPFTGPNEMEIIRAVRRASPEPLERLATHAPEALVALVRRAMAPAPEDRFQSAAAFRDALHAFARRHGTGFRRSRLAAWMRAIWAEDIERELRALEELVLDLPERPEEVDLGRNLLADALGPDASYRHFHPSPTRITGERTASGAAVREAGAAPDPGLTVPAGRADEPREPR